MGLRVNPSLKKYVDDLFAALHPAKIKTGSYTGNGIDNRNIDIGVNLLEKSFKWVVIKANSTIAGCHKPSSLAGDAAQFFVNSANSDDIIQSFTATGFQVGSDSYANYNGTVFQWVAIWEE
ncbi:hypothetical protein ES705_10546 [subsurface metagenome]